MKKTRKNRMKIFNFHCPINIRIVVHYTMYNEDNILIFAILFLYPGSMNTRLVIRLYNSNDTIVTVSSQHTTKVS